jgi:hypothetical protein
MKEYDMHLAANAITPKTVAQLAEAGFQRDEFANLTYCHTGDYHGTYRGQLTLPDRNLWNHITLLLERDEKFSGYLEEELCTEDWRRTLGNDNLFEAIEPLPPVNMIKCPAEIRKACDIHMAVFLSRSSQVALDYMARLQASSVDRPGDEGIRRVFTITCASLADGRQLFTELYYHLSRVPNLHGRMKLEVTTRHYRKPADAVTLPIATKEDVASWFAECRSRRFIAGENQFSHEREVAIA